MKRDAVSGMQSASRRNTVVVSATAAALGLLMLYPTSTHHGVEPRKPGQALAPAGVLQPSQPAAVTTVNGSSVDTRYGPVQVQLQLRAGRIVAATAIDFPQAGNRDRQINSAAIPLLDAETLTAQNAAIDTVSGATYTSAGYRQSLQAALDAATAAVSP